MLMAPQKAFAQRIAGPLQMQDFDIRDGKYVSGPESVHRVYAFRMSARDLARFGWLYLNNIALASLDVG